MKKFLTLISSTFIFNFSDAGKLINVSNNISGSMQGDSIC